MGPSEQRHLLHLVLARIQEEGLSERKAAEKIAMDWSAWNRWLKQPRRRPVPLDALQEFAKLGIPLRRLEIATRTDVGLNEAQQYQLGLYSFAMAWDDPDLSEEDKRREIEATIKALRDRLGKDPDD